MENNELTEDELRQQIARLRDDLAVLEGSRALAIGSANYSEDAVEAIKKKIAELESMLDGSDTEEDGKTG